MPPHRAVPTALVLLLATAAGAAPAPRPVHADAGGYQRFVDGGRALVFTVGASRELWIHEFADGATRKLSEGLPATERIDGPFWTMTPDGSKVLFASFPVEGSYDPRFQHLYMVGRDGTGLARVVEGFQDSLATVLPDQLADGYLLLRLRSPGGGLDLYAFHFEDRALVRLSQPAHAKARVDFVLRAPVGDQVVYVGDDEAEGVRRLWQVDPRGGGRLELTARLPREFRVLDTLPGRSDRPHDKDPVKLADGGRRVLFTAQDPASGFGAFDPRHLYQVPLGGGPIDELFRTERGEGTFEFWPVDARGEVVVRAHVPESNHYMVNLDTLARRPLHRPAVGWQGSYEVMPCPQVGRVFWFGDLEDQDVRGYLYSARFDGSDSRRHTLRIPYGERGALFPALDDRGTAIVFRGNTRLASPFELFAVATAEGGPQLMLSDPKGKTEVRWFELVPGRAAAVFTEGGKLFYRGLTDPAATLLSGTLPAGVEVGGFAVSQDGQRAAFTARAKGQPAQLQVVDLP